MPYAARITLFLLVALFVAALAVHLIARRRLRSATPIRLASFAGHTGNVLAALRGKPAPWQPDPDTGMIAYRDAHQARAHRGNPPTYGSLFDAGELREEPRRHRRIPS